MRNFSARFKPYAAMNLGLGRPKASQRDSERGYTLAVPQETVYPNTALTHRPEPITLRATPGETVSATFALQPLADIGATAVTLEPPIAPPAAGEHAIDPSPMAVGFVRYEAKKAGQGRWAPQPGMILPVEQWVMQKGVTKQFWLDYRVPENMMPGRYHGRLVITPSAAVRTEMPFEIEVLPFRLERPDHLSLGMTYFSPVQDAWFDEERFWQRLAAEFADMRKQGFTMVQFTGIGIGDHERMDRVMQIYTDAGFERPIMLLESYGAMDRLRRDGIAWGSAEFYRAYQNSISELLEAARDRNWPPLIINFGDEFTNSAQEEFGVQVARTLKQIPGIVTSADANGYKEVSLLAPEVDILAFNNGWAGPDQVNGERKLLNEPTVKMVRNSGAEPWFVNVGRDRFSNGFWLWKMARLGVRGRLQWIYRSYEGMPYNPMDAKPLRAQLAYPGPANTMLHSLEFEMMRLGFTDLAYLHTLEQSIAASREVADPAALQAAMRFIEQLAASIDQDLRRMQSSDAERWPADKYNATRNQAIDHILALRQR